MSSSSNNDNYFNQEFLIKTILSKVKKYYKNLQYKGVLISHLVAVDAYWLATTDKNLIQNSNNNLTSDIAIKAVDGLLKINKLKIAMGDT